MPRKMAIVDYSACYPERCDQGLCLAALACPRKVLRQEMPFEMPEPNPTMCAGCGVCVVACPVKAIHVSAT
jgi:translation initiation factor RLI1